MLRQRIYLSSGKVAAFEDGLKLSLAEAEFEVNAKIARARTLFSPSGAGNGETRRKLDKILKERDRDARDFTDPGVRPGDWIRFDLPMGYGTSGKDSVRPGVPDDIALFGGTLEGEMIGEQRPYGLMLCGSACHMMDRTESAGRLGSGVSWLYRTIREAHAMEEEGIEGIPDHARDPATRPRRVYSLEHMAQDVFHWFERDYPPRRRTRFSGFAQVLLHADEPRWVRRLVVASPLCVDYGNFRNVRSIRNLLKRSRPELAR
ncbi:SAVMC3_10250 family protein [Streptomyces reniochalinae]|uniref:SAVMC3_10250 family protein n=1 Tax=Streptomyces reniochalinae TaxID=2250578 RepID=UPI0011C02E43|nr:SAVMC3_10250 family protein [Streptomyces reniochalinae]